MDEPDQAILRALPPVPRDDLSPIHCHFVGTIPVALHKTALPTENVCCIPPPPPIPPSRTYDKNRKQDKTGKVIVQHAR